MSEIDWKYENGILSVPISQAEKIEENSLVFSRIPLNGDLAMGYRVKNLSRDSGAIRMNVEEVDGTMIFSDYHMLVGQQVKMGPLKARSTGNLLEDNLLGDAEERKVNFNINLSNDVSIKAEVTLSMHLDAEYGGTGLPTGYAILTKNLHVVSSVMYKNNLASGSIAKLILSSLGSESVDKCDKLLEVDYYS